MALTPVILAGGSGSRLWPMSRAAYPKQFLSLGGESSLLQQTLTRASGDRYAAPMIVTNEEYRFHCAAQACEIGLTPTILLEPAARNTAPAIAAAAHAALRRDIDAVLHVMPSDHALKVDPAYQKALDAAEVEAAKGGLVTFGVEPKSPATGYGYIKAVDGTGSRAVARFVEKPDRSRAEAMLAEGGYFWNSGMFLFRADAFLEELERLAPDVDKAALGAVAGARKDLSFLRLDAASFEASPSISVDYAVFEKTDKAVVVPAAIQWSDLGAWSAIWERDATDPDAAVTLGEASAPDSRRILAVSDGPRVVAQGVEDLAVIAADDVVYVGKLSESERVRDVVATLAADPDTAPLTQEHRTIHRPWGGYTSVYSGTRFQVKRLFVKPGGRLSLQKHHHRSEHWVVVSGTAEVTIDDKVVMLGEDESTYIPQGSVHRLANPGKILLELIEVQTGAYLGEDDIIRIEDEFGRS